MYVCVCNSVTDRQIREAVERGCDSMAKLRHELKVATCCGKCQPCAHEVLADCLAESPWSPEFVAAAT
jgi:bacterioferritin-associated ferredoxin